LLLHKLIAFCRFIIVMNAHKISSSRYKSLYEEN
jgi:hypothetical protein